jgi:fatty acid desaturase
MTTSKPYPVAALWAVVTLSSLTMLGLFWRFPVPTCIASIALLATLLHCAHFARLVDLGARAEDRGGPDLGKLDHQT